MDHPVKRQKSTKYVEHRCGSCGHLLLRSQNLSGKVEHKCGRCGSVNSIEIQPDGRSYQDRINLATK